MSNQARISSINALEAFRVELIQSLENARVALEDMTGEARRTRAWLDVERTRHWGARLRKLATQLHQAYAGSSRPTQLKAPPPEGLEPPTPESAP
ncbi:MAG: hypothetical protein NTW21_34870 [Verrucomicrobia bacterium]|nr:hypothetical protein [Verrucomicrobiota bacterium]